MYAIKTIFEQPYKFLLTATGIAFCVILVFFLLGIYRGVSVGSVEYVRKSNADLWVLQKHANNILRSTSILRSKHGVALEELEGIDSVGPVVFIMASVQLPQGAKTLYFTGYDEETRQGGPPELFSGRNIAADREVVLDHSFAAKYHIKLGDSLKVKNDTLQVVGLSKGTNMFVIQYAFISLSEAYRIVGFTGIASCYLVKLKKNTDAKSMIQTIRRTLPDVEVYDRETFLKNNIMELESGILPLLFFIAMLSCVLLTSILSLILSINVLERRKDFAVMKAIGAPVWFIMKTVIYQSFLLSFSGLLIALSLFYPLIYLVEFLSPEVSIMVSIAQISAVTGGVLFISLVSAIFPIIKLRKIYPMEVFK
jgi:ABC-type antimicrobial peptide transport system permease subunit